MGGRGASSSIAKVGFSKNQMLNEISSIKNNAYNNYKETLDKARKDTGLWDANEMPQNVIDKLNYYSGKQQMANMLEETNKEFGLKTNELKKEIDYRKNILKDEDLNDNFNKGMYDTLKDLEKFIKK